MAPNDEGVWNVKAENASRASNSHDAKADAIVRTEELAKAQPLGLVVISLAGMGIMTLRAMAAGYGETWSLSMVAWMVGVIMMNVAAAGGALSVGIRHFNRVEC